MNDISKLFKFTVINRIYNNSFFLPPRHSVRLIKSCKILWLLRERHYIRHYITYAGFFLSYENKANCSQPMAEKTTVTQLSQALNSQGQNFVTVGISSSECYASFLCTKTTAILWKTIIVLILSFYIICVKWWQDNLGFPLLRICDIFSLSHPQGCYLGHRRALWDHPEGQVVLMEGRAL